MRLLLLVVVLVAVVLVVVVVVAVAVVLLVMSRMSLLAIAVTCSVYAASCSLLLPFRSLCGCYRVVVVLVLVAVVAVVAMAAGSRSAKPPGPGAAPSIGGPATGVVLQTSGLHPNSIRDSVCTFTLHAKARYGTNPTAWHRSFSSLFSFMISYYTGGDGLGHVESNCRAAHCGPTRGNRDSNW